MMRFFNLFSQNNEISGDGVRVRSMKGWGEKLAGGTGYYIGSFIGYFIKDHLNQEAGRTGGDAAASAATYLIPGIGWVFSSFARKVGSCCSRMIGTTVMGDSVSNAISTRFADKFGHCGRFLDNVVAGLTKFIIGDNLYSKLILQLGFQSGCTDLMIIPSPIHSPSEMGNVESLPNVHCTITKPDARTIIIKLEATENSKSFPTSPKSLTNNSWDKGVRTIKALWDKLVIGIIRSNYKNAAIEAAKYAQAINLVRDAIEARKSYDTFLIAHKVGFDLCGTDPFKENKQLANINPNFERFAHLEAKAAKRLIRAKKKYVDEILATDKRPQFWILDRHSDKSRKYAARLASFIDTLRTELSLKCSHPHSYQEIVKAAQELRLSNPGVEPNLVLVAERIPDLRISSPNSRFTHIEKRNAERIAAAKKEYMTPNAIEVRSAVRPAIVSR